MWRPDEVVDADLALHRPQTSHVVDEEGLVDGVAVELGGRVEALVCVVLLSNQLALHQHIPVAFFLDSSQSSTLMQTFCSQCQRQGHFLKPVHHIQASTQRTGHAVSGNAHLVEDADAICV